jgi:hypothetical protein
LDGASAGTLKILADLHRFTQNIGIAMQNGNSVVDLNGACRTE